MIQAADCPNYEINKQMCPCTETDCERHGICCECVAYHRKSTQWPLTACMRTNRLESTLSLAMATDPKCDNYERNKENCPCTNEACDRLGTCCDCIRNHWKADGSGQPACLRQAG